MYRTIDNLIVNNQWYEYRYQRSLTKAGTAVVRCPCIALPRVARRRIGRSVHSLARGTAPPVGASSPYGLAGACWLRDDGPPARRTLRAAEQDACGLTGKTGFGQPQYVGTVCSGPVYRVCSLGQTWRTEVRWNLSASALHNRRSSMRQDAEGAEDAEKQAALRSNIRTLQRGALGMARMRAGGTKVNADVLLRVQLVIVNIAEINTEGQTFMADVVVEAVAEGRYDLVRDLEAEKEPGQDVPPKYKNGDKPPKPEALFNPGATILNAKDVDLIEESVETRQRDAVWRWRWRGDFSEEFELLDFPFDVQDFSIKVSTRSAAGFACCSCTQTVGGDS